MRFSSSSGLPCQGLSPVLLLALFLCLSLAGVSNVQAKRPRILYINSATEENYWWRTSSGILQAACDNLEMDLKVVYVDRNQFKMQDVFKAAAAGPDRPDAVIFQNLKQNAVEMLTIAEQNKMPVFIFNAGLSKEQMARYGGPRQHFKYWIGQMLPDDQTAGYDLALALYSQALKQGLADSNGKVHVIGINGTSSDGAAIERAAGLALALKQQPNLVLHQLVSANWERDKSKEVFLGLLARYPQARVVWAANDLMALGVLDAMHERNMLPGKTMLTGSIDWIPQALEAVTNDQLFTTIGGHFMETAWVAVLLHDYFQNRDFASETLSFKSKMTPLAKPFSVDYLREFKPENFKKIDFRQFSKARHPEINSYNFDFTVAIKKMLREKDKTKANPGS